jgi:uncharacterized protein (TIGR00251 family)
MQSETRIAIKAIPNASKDEIVGWLGDAIKIRVRQPPENGKANRNICLLLANHLKISEKNITIVAGSTSPRKTIAIQNCSIHTIKSLIK